MDENVLSGRGFDPQTREKYWAYLFRRHLRPVLLRFARKSSDYRRRTHQAQQCSALRDTVEAMLRSTRIQSLSGVLEALQGSPYIRKEKRRSCGGSA